MFDLCCMQFSLANLRSQHSSQVQHGHSSSDEGETWGDPINLDGEGSAGGVMSGKSYTMPMNAKEASELSAWRFRPAS